MVRLAAVLAVLTLMPGPGRAWAGGGWDGGPWGGNQGPVCRIATVVDEMTRQVRATDHYASVDPRLITEQATGTPDRVLCNVCVEQAPYEMLTFGPRPVRRCIAHDFEIRILQAGFVVRDVR